MDVRERFGLVFENFWKKDVSPFQEQILEIWRRNGGPQAEEAEARLRQVVFAVKNRSDEVVGLSTAFKAYIKPLRSYFYVIRMLIVPQFRIPGLTSQLLVSTRDFLESVHQMESADIPIGVMTLVQNDALKRSRNEAIWPASKMVYIGNSPEGHHIRVYYFQGARVQP